MLPLASSLRVHKTCHIAACLSAAFLNSCNRRVVCDRYLRPWWIFHGIGLLLLFNLAKQFEYCPPLLSVYESLIRSSVLALWTTLLIPNILLRYCIASPLVAQLRLSWQRGVGVCDFSTVPWRGSIDYVQIWREWPGTHFMPSTSDVVCLMSCLSFAGIKIFCFLLFFQIFRLVF